MYPQAPVAMYERVHRGVCVWTLSTPTPRRSDISSCIVSAGGLCSASPLHHQGATHSTFTNAWTRCMQPSHSGMVGRGSQAVAVQDRSCCLLKYSITYQLCSPCGAEAATTGNSAASSLRSLCDGVLRMPSLHILPPSSHQSTYAVRLSSCTLAL